MVQTKTLVEIPSVSWTDFNKCKFVQELLLALVCPECKKIDEITEIEYDRIFEVRCLNCKTAYNAVVIPREFPSQTSFLADEEVYESLEQMDMLRRSQVMNEAFRLWRSLKTESSFEQTKKSAEIASITNNESLLARQNAFDWLTYIKSDLTASQYSVMMFFVNSADVKHYVASNQKEISTRTKVAAPVVSAAIRALIEKGLIKQLSKGGYELLVKRVIAIRELD